MFAGGERTLCLCLFGAVLTLIKSGHGWASAFHYICQIYKHTAFSFHWTLAVGLDFVLPSHDNNHHQQTFICSADDTFIGLTRFHKSDNIGYAKEYSI